MWISNKEYAEKEELIDAQRTRIAALRDELDHIRGIKLDSEKRCEILEQNNSKLIKQQDQLIEWVMKIINDVGIYKVDKTNIESFVIPMMEKITTKSYAEGKIFFETKDITLPEIRIHQVSTRKEDSNAREQKFTSES